MNEEFLKVLFIGDVVGRPGRKLIYKYLEEIKESMEPDFIIMNIENAAAGFGITEKILNEFISLNLIDVFTSGNHIWDKKETEKFIDKYDNLLRPLNYPPSVKGKGYILLQKGNKKIAVVNLLGRTLMKDCVDCPFRTIDLYLGKLKEYTKNIIIDFHAEATSEKEAMGFFLDGKVSAVIGTHTHVQTADNRILKEGTGYITDCGMTGSIDAVIGFRVKEVLEKFLNQIPRKFEITSEGLKEIQGVFLVLDNNTGKTLSIERVKFLYEK